MRIDADNNYLSLERIKQEGPAPVWRVVAGVAKEGCFAAVASRAKVLATTETSRRMADYTAHRSHRFEVTLSGGGWLRLRRGRSGRMLVSYRVGRWGRGATLEGRLPVERRCAAALCRELEGLL